jgi:hypothetical protein
MTRGRDSRQLSQNGNRCGKMKSSLLGILRKCGVVVAVLMLMSVAAAAPALAVTGAVTPRLVYKAAGPRLYEYTWGGNMTGWKRGTLTIEAKFYVAGSQAGERGPTKCLNSTYCTLADTTSTYPYPKQVKVVVTGCGPGGCVTESKSWG